MKINNSIVFRIGALLTAMTAMAIISMFSSFVISEMADNDAAAINISGSLRKQSYILLNDLLVQEPDTVVAITEQHASHIAEFENILKHPVLLNHFDERSGDRLSILYQEVQRQWFNDILPGLQTFTASADQKSRYVLKINDFVEHIDNLVYEYQREAESKIEWLRIIQVIALFATLILVYVAMSNINVHIEQPLKQLTELAIKLKHGELGERIDLKSRDELGVLAGAFNAMSEALSDMYGDLENRVAIQTRELKRSNDSLTFLFDISRKTNQGKDDDLDFQKILDEVVRLTEINDMDLCLSTPQSVSPYIHMLAVDQFDDRSNCDGNHCDACQGEGNFGTTNKESYQVKFPLIQDEQNFGVLVVRIAFDKGMDNWQYQLIQSVADQIAMILSLRNQANQERRVSLLNERTIIARELHDSLAQSLSYLKIQVTRLQKSHDKGVQKETFQELIDEIREGLSSAYRQLRELLSTFRLKIDGDGLKGALHDAVAQLQSRSDMKILINYEIDAIPLTPNEEIHLLQIAKEALQNATHHSKGNEVVVNVKKKDKTIVLTVCDDGIGIPDDPEKMNHYGLAIMKERAKHLNGDLTMYRQDNGGTCVEMKFLVAEFLQ